MPKEEVIKYIFELDDLIAEVKLAQKNMYAILETLDQWTKDHFFIAEVLWCPTTAIFDAVDKMTAQQEAMMQKLKEAEV